jgi:GNAT superfamily N-acetyltransferase
MLSPPTRPVPAPPAIPHAIIRADNITLSFYRYLYGTVGADNLWWERRVMSDAQLREKICTEAVDIFVLHVSGTPAGYFELKEERPTAVIELAYFGLIPEFIGRGFGKYLLRAAIDEAWRRGIDRLWVHTCDLDHKNALPLYQKAGFEPYRQETQRITDPRSLGIFDLR